MGSPCNNSTENQERDKPSSITTGVTAPTDHSPRDSTIVSDCGHGNAVNVPANVVVAEGNNGQVSEKHLRRTSSASFGDASCVETGEAVLMTARRRRRRELRCIFPPCHFISQHCSGAARVRFPCCQISDSLYNVSLAPPRTEDRLGHRTFYAWRQDLITEPCDLGAKLDSAADASILQESMARHFGWEHDPTFVPEHRIVTLSEKQTVQPIGHLKLVLQIPNSHFEMSVDFYVVRNSQFTKTDCLLSEKAIVRQHLMCKSLVCKVRLFKPMASFCVRHLRWLRLDGEVN